MTHNTISNSSHRYLDLPAEITRRITHYSTIQTWTIQSRANLEEIAHWTPRKPSTVLQPPPHSDDWPLTATGCFWMKRAPALSGNPLKPYLRFFYKRLQYPPTADDLPHYLFLKYVSLWHITQSLFHQQWLQQEGIFWQPRLKFYHLGKWTNLTPQFKLFHFGEIRAIKKIRAIKNHTYPSIISLSRYCTYPFTSFGSVTKTKQNLDDEESTASIHKLFETRPYHQTIQRVFAAWNIIEQYKEFLRIETTFQTFYSFGSIIFRQATTPRSWIDIKRNDTVIQDEPRQDDAHHQNRQIEEKLLY